MAVHLTEEEQFENLKRWWRENGKFTLVAVVLAVGAYLGWEGWQDRQQSSSETASAVYQNLLTALEAEQGTPHSEEQAANVRHLAGQLKEDFASNLYASQAALFLARQAVESGDLAKAGDELAWVVEQDVDPALTLLTKSRLARVRVAQGDFDAALGLLVEPDNSAFTASFAELRGDILLQRGKAKEARAAYRLAMDNLVEGQEGRSRLLQIKLDDLQATPVVGMPVSDPDASESGSQADAMNGEKS